MHLHIIWYIYSGLYLKAYNEEDSGICKGT
ncbi:MAG: hypothetical protein ACJA0U_003565 [Salibacteraceae bacterium]|jgi:hypothetical protein